MPRAKQQARAKQELAEHHNLPCPYCLRLMIFGHPMLKPTRDHILARSVSKVHRYSGRTIICCLECNQIKAHYSFSALVTMLTLRNQQLIQQLSLNQTRMRNIDYFIRTGLEE